MRECVREMCIINEIFHRFVSCATLGTKSNRDKKHWVQKAIGTKRNGDKKHWGQKAIGTKLRTKSNKDAFNLVQYFGLR